MPEELYFGTPFLCYPGNIKIRASVSEKLFLKFIRRHIRLPICGISVYLCIFRNLHGVKFADFNFISLFTRFASFATSASPVLPFKFNTENAILFTCRFTKFTLNKFSIKLILKINLSHRKASDNEFYRPKGAKMKLYLLQKSELILGTVFLICSLFYLDFYFELGILRDGTIGFVIFSFPLAFVFNILMLAINFKRTRAIFFALIGAFIL